MSKVTEASQIYPVFRDLFKAEGAPHERKPCRAPRPDPRSPSRRRLRPERSLPLAAAAAGPRAEKPLPDPSDWTFELIEQLPRDDPRRRPQRFGLDTYPNQLEVITAEQMMDAYASVGMPVNYRHWSYGKEFIANEKNYRRGHMGLAYEIVINSNPCISYLMEENTMAMQALVIAHAAYGHNSFFKGNYLFRMWTDASSIIDYLVYAQELRRRMRGAPRPRRGRGAARQLPCADEPRRRPLSPAEQACRWPRSWRARKDREAYAQRRSTTLWRTLPQAAPRRTSDAPEAKRFPRSRRRTCSTSSRRTRRCSSRGSARSCASCARSRSTSIRSARRR